MAWIAVRREWRFLIAHGTLTGLAAHTGQHADAGQSAASHSTPSPTAAATASLGTPMAIATRAAPSTRRAISTCNMLRNGYVPLSMDLAAPLSRAMVELSGSRDEASADVSAAALTRIYFIFIDLPASHADDHGTDATGRVRP